MQARSAFRARLELALSRPATSPHHPLTAPAPPCPRQGPRRRPSCGSCRAPASVAASCPALSLLSRSLVVVVAAVSVAQGKVFPHARVLAVHCPRHRVRLGRGLVAVVSPLDRDSTRRHRESTLTMTLSLPRASTHRSLGPRRSMENASLENLEAEIVRLTKVSGSTVAPRWEASVSHPWPGQRATSMEAARNSNQTRTIDQARPGSASPGRRWPWRRRFRPSCRSTRHSVNASLVGAASSICRRARTRPPTRAAGVPRPGLRSPSTRRPGCRRRGVPPAGRSSPPGVRRGDPLR